MSARNTGTVESPRVRASVKHLHASATKVRQVLALIRGLGAEDAERVLQLCQKDAAGDILKVLDSAIANAENNNSLSPEELYVVNCYADEGPTRKWGQPRARGRYFRVRHRSSHVTIELARYSEEDLEQKRRREEASTGGRGRAASRRRAERVRRSRAAAHDHDHDHDHDEVPEPEPTGGPVSEAELEATDERDEDLAEASGDIEAEAEAGGAEAGDDEADDEEESE
jgi:large subunit ribosomal protein L22